MPARQALRDTLPLAAILAVAALAGLATVGDFGLTWDEPAFYQYADAIGQAYSIDARLAGTFDIEQAYGPDNHRQYGPAYVLLANPIVRLFIRTGGFDRPDAWHFTNFLVFLAGTAGIYFLSRRWMSHLAALTAALLFLTQPVLWGHAFINPKDIPFMVFFTLSVVLGFRMVDRARRDDGGVSSGGPVEAAGRRPRAADPPPTDRRSVRLRLRSRDLISAALLLGLTTAIRVLGPVAGLLVAAYSVFTHRVKGLALILAYALIAAVGALAAWPYLWGAPFLRFAEVLTHMARNPAILPVLFQGDLMWSNELPPIYLPALLALTLTLPAIFLSLGGMVIALGRIRSAFGESFPLALALLWFAVPFTYVVFLRPPMYDGFRHFLFILPPLFATAGLAVEAILRRLRLGPWRALFLIGVLVPGIVGIARLHPYAYAYFNELAGGPAGAFREYESDYWLMCYKEGIERANRLADRPRTVFVFAVPEIAEHYAGPLVTIEKFDAGDDQTSPGDWILMTTRNNADLRVHVGDPILFSIGRLGATYCVMKQVPGEGSAG